LTKKPRKPKEGKSKPVLITLESKSQRTSTKRNVEGIIKNIKA